MLENLFLIKMKGQKLFKDAQLYISTMGKLLSYPLNRFNT